MAQSRTYAYLPGVCKGLAFNLGTIIKISVLPGVDLEFNYRFNLTILD